MQNFMITLLTCSVLMSVLGLFYMAVTPFLAKRYSTKGQYYAWLMIIVGLIIPFRPQFDNSIVKITPTNTITPVIQIGNSAPILSPAEYTVARISAISPRVSLWQMVTIIWFVGVVVFLAYYLIKHYHFLAMVKRWSEPITNEQVLSLLQALKKELGISKEIGFRQCLCVGSPILVGFIHPCILLPKTDFEEEELRFIVKHELVHYRRKDLWYKLLVLIATALHWFNPIVYLIARSIEVLCEMSCDTEVVRSTDADKRQYYSEAILKVARYHSKLKTNLSTNFYGGKKSMKKRILSIMDTSKKRTGIVVVCAIVLLTLGTGTAFAVNAASESTSKSTSENEPKNTSNNTTEKTPSTTNDNPLKINYTRLEYDKSDYKWPMNVISVTNTGELILNYELVCLAYDKDGQPLELYWDALNVAENGEVGSVGYGPDGVDYGIVTGISPVSPKSYKCIYMADSTSSFEDINDILLDKTIEVDEATKELAIEMKHKRWVKPGETQTDGYILFDSWNQSTGEHEVNYLISFIKSVIFEDGTVWENPEYEKWISDYEGKSVDIEFLEESP